MKKLFRFRTYFDNTYITSYIGDEEIILIPDTDNSGRPILGISNGCFLKCDRKIRYNIKEIIIPDTIKLIEKNAFRDLKNLKKITLPNNLRSIDKNAFSFCSNLKEITFPPNLNSIGTSAFSHCHSLKKITSLVDYNEISVFKYAFEKCDSLEDVSLNFINLLEFNAQIKIWINLILNFNNVSIDKQNEISALISKKPKLKNTLFLSNELELITILLEKIIKPKLPTLNEYINYHIEKQNTTIIAFLLEYKKNNFTQKKLNAYEENIELVELGFELPTLAQLKKKWIVNSHDSKILIKAYKGDNSHEELPPKTKGGVPILYIGRTGEYSENNYHKLKSLSLPEGLTEIFDEAFMNMNLENISLPQTLKHIHDSAFFNCINLKEIHLPNSLETIGNYAFSYCISLTEIVIPEKIKVIPEHAFFLCGTVEKVVLPKGLEVIEEKAFDGCQNIQEIVIFNPENILIKCNFFKAELEKRNLL